MRNLYCCSRRGQPRSTWILWTFCGYLVKLPAVLLLCILVYFWCIGGITYETSNTRFLEHGASRADEKLYRQIVPLHLNIPLDRPEVASQRGKVGNEKTKMVNAMYIGGDDPREFVESVRLELLRVGLGEKLAIREMGLNLVDSRAVNDKFPSPGQGKNAFEKLVNPANYGHVKNRSMEGRSLEKVLLIKANNTNGRDTIPRVALQYMARNRFQLLILGSGPVLNPKVLRSLQNFKDKHILFAGSGLATNDLWCDKDGMPCPLSSVRTGNGSCLKHSFVSGIKILTSALNSLDSKQTTFTGGLRGNITGSVIAAMLKEQSVSQRLPVIGDILLTAADFYGTDRDYDVYQQMLIPVHERYIVLNVANSNVIQNPQVDALQALLDLIPHYHVVLYPLSTTDVPAVNKMAKRLTLALRRIEKPLRLYPYPEAFASKMHVFQKPPDVPILGRILQGAHISLNYRPEASYLSATYGTPFVAMAMSVEVLDLVETLRLHKFSLVGADIGGAADVPEAVQHCLTEHAHISKILALYREKVVLDYRRVFERLARKLAMPLPSSNDTLEKV